MRGLQQFFIVAIIFITAYLVTVRAIISWAQVSPVQLVSFVEKVSSAEIDYQSLKIRQTWKGMALDVKKLKYQSDFIDFNIESMQIDLNIYSPFLYGINYGKFLHIEGMHLYLPPIIQEKKISFSSVVELLRGFSNDRLWEKIQVKNSQINFQDKEDATIHIDSFNSFKGSKWRLSADARVTYRQAIIAHFRAQGIFKTNLLGKVEKGHYSLDFLSPTEIKTAKQFIPSDWSTSLPYGDLMLELEGSVYDNKDKVSFLEIELNAKNLIWEDYGFELPNSLAAAIKWQPNLNEQNSSSGNWSLEFSSIHVDDVYISMSDYIAINLENGHILTFEAANLSLKPFKLLVLNTLKSQNIKLSEQEKFALEINSLQGKINLNTAMLDELDLSIKKMSWPAHGKIPSVLLNDLSVTKNNRLLQVFTQSPIVVSSKFLRREPVEITMKDSLSVIIQRNDKDKLQWSMEDYNFEVDAIPVEIAVKAGYFGYIDAEISFFSRELKQVKNFLPYPMMSNALESWLKTSLVEGRNIKGNLELKGHLKDFPFKNGEGIFVGNIYADNMVLKFDPYWPALTDFNAHLKFTPYSLQISTNSAKLMEVDIGKALVHINDLESKNIAVEIQTSASSNVQSVIDLFLSSPLASTPRVNYFFKNQVEASGDLYITLPKIWIPVHGFNERVVEVSGSVTVQETNIKLFDEIEFKSMEGEVKFTEESIVSQEITGYFENGPVSIDVSTQNKAVNLNLKGRALLDFPKYLSGAVYWSGKVEIPFVNSKLVRVHVEADLTEIKSQLPRPFDTYFFKSKAENVSAEIVVHDGYLAVLGELSDWGKVSAQWSLAEEQFSFLNAHLGVETLTRVNKGIHVVGNVDYLDIDEWREFFSNIKTQSPAFDKSLERVDWNQSNISVDKLIVLKNEFDNTIFNWHYYNHISLLKLNVLHQDLKLEVSKKEGQSFQIGLDRLKISTKNWGEDTGENFCPEESWYLPSMVFLGKEIYLDERKIDSVSFKVETIDSLIKIKDIDARVNAFEGRIKGEYLFDLKSNMSDLNFRIDSGNVEKLSQFLDIQRGFNGKYAYVSGNLKWTGELYCFAIENLRGRIEASVKNGVIEDADPGIARIIGLLSIKSIGRRLRLDMEDLIVKGLAFDEIKARGRLEKGVMSIEKFKLKAPAADAEMFGKVNLVDQTINATIRITPAIVGTIPMIAALTGIINPIGTLAAYALMKLIPEINEDLVTYNYDVSGSIFSPEIKRK